MKKSALLVVAALCAGGVVHANPRALPFTYTTDTLVPGAAELEQVVDLVPSRAQGSEGAQWVMPSAFQTEIEIGLADRLELGLYMTFVPQASVGAFPAGIGAFPGVGNGLKQRLRYIFADPNEWPIDVGVYVELTETEREVELEGKLLLQKRFGDLRIAANLSNEYELYLSKQREYVLNPSLGATYEISPKLHVGIDAFVRGEYPLHPKPPTRTFGLGPEAYVGPAVMMNFGKLWWTVGAYARVTDFSHELQVDEPYGPLWFRSMIGYDL